VSGEAMRASALGLLAGTLTPAEAAHRTGHRTPAAHARTFQARFHAPPAAFAELPRTGRLRLTYGGPYDHANALAYLARDPANAAERVEGARYRRLLPADGRAVAVTLELAADGCEVAVAPGLGADALLELHGVLLRVLGLGQPVQAFYRASRAHPVMGPLTRQLRGVRMMCSPTLWEALCWAVLGQQINLAFAYRLRNRLIRLGNGLPAEPAPEEPPAPDPLPFPTPEQVLALDVDTLRAHQFSRQKSAYLGHVARAVTEGPLRDASLERTAPEELEAALLAVKGIGRWSAAYGLMRGLGHLDAVPVGDVGLRIALERQFGLETPPDAAAQEALMEPFRPFRSLATYYLWRSLRLTPAE